jgi:hypothetical protein
MSTILKLDNLQYISSVSHEGKIILVASDATGKLWYSIKQDGFEDSYLNTPPELRTGWENWKVLELPNEDDDLSVIAKEKAELSYKDTPNQFIFHSVYRSNTSAAVPVKLLSALGHVYIFRQSTANTLYVDRYVLDGMTNQLVRKLDVRFKRSRQKYQTSSAMKKTNTGELSNVDGLDFRDANGNEFHEATTELSCVANLLNGWFDVVLVPTLESDIFRWHIFAYNSSTQKIELTTLRSSDEGLFAAKDYTIFENINGRNVPRTISGVIKRTLELSVTVTNGLAASTYDIQQEQKAQSGEMQLIRMATRLMLVVPTATGTATLSFGIAGDGTLAQVDESAEFKEVRSSSKEVLLPLNTLEAIKSFADKTPSPKGIVSGFALSTEADGVEDVVKITAQNAAQLTNDDWITLTGTLDYQGVYGATPIDKNTFKIAIPKATEIGYWEKQELVTGGLEFDGMVSSYRKTADGELTIISQNHGLVQGDSVQLKGMTSYDGEYPVTKLDDNNFVIDRKWTDSEAVNIRLESYKRRGLVFDGTGDYIGLPKSSELDLIQKSFTVEVWINPAVLTGERIIIGDNHSDAVTDARFLFELNGTNVRVNFVSNMLQGKAVLTANTWNHVAFRYTHLDEQGKFIGEMALFVNGNLDKAENGHNPLKALATPTVSDYGLFIGRLVGFDGLQFSGQIADVRIWNVARRAEDIKNNMCLPLQGKELGLIGYWRLGAIAEGKVVDFSVNGNDGDVFGDCYVGAVKLDRNLKDGSPAVKYSNSELIAVSARATYKESFEFKVNAATPVTLDKLNNCDGLGNKLFGLSYWGKSSRNSETIIAIAAVQDKFVDLGNGWFRVSCQFTIPEGVSMLRSFELTQVKGSWTSLEIRKQAITLLSDNINIANYTDTFSLTPLADKQAGLVGQYQQLKTKEFAESFLLKERNRLDDLVALYQLPAADAIAKKQAEVNAQQAIVSTYASQVNYWSNENTLMTTNVTVFRYDNYNIDVKNSGDKETYNFQVGLYDLGNKKRLNRTINNPSELPDETYRDMVAITEKCKSDELYVSLRIPTGLKVQTYSHQVSYYPPGDRVKFSTLQAPNIYTVDTPSLRYFNCMSIITTNGNGDPKVVADELKKAQDKLAASQKILDPLKADLATLQSDSATKAQKLKEYQDLLVKVTNQLNSTQTEINTLNAAMLNTLATTQQTPQTMPQVIKDSRGLITQGALLSFVNAAGRVHLMETCEGNVQLSYFDTQGRLRQSLYDACADSRNSSFEQWLVDSQRACINFDRLDSLITLASALPITNNWTVETWFLYPLPAKINNTVIKTNTLISSSDANSQIVVKENKRLGIMATVGQLANDFYECGFDLSTLTGGWHHLAVISADETTLFYIDGNTVGDTKTKAIDLAQNAVNLKPTDTALQTKLTTVKNTPVITAAVFSAVGNNPVTKNQPFGKLAELRIWGTALTGQEVNINSKTLLSANEPDLVAYYPLNEATGSDILDNTGNGYKGTAVNSSWFFCTAPIGNFGAKVLQFDGINDYLEVNTDYSAIRSAQSFTVETWVNAQKFIDALPALTATNISQNPYDDNLSFNGNNATVEFPKTSPFNFGKGSFTIEFWIKGGGTGLILSNQNYWRNGFAVSVVTNTIYFTITDSNTTSCSASTSNSFGDDKWHHIAGVVDRTNNSLVLFVDGIALSSYYISYPDPSNSSRMLGKNYNLFVPIPNNLQEINCGTTVCIGRNPNTNANDVYTGQQIADVRIWNVARTATDIKNNYTRCLNGNENGLIAYWQLSSASSVNDLTANANHGKVSGAVKSSANIQPLIKQSSKQGKGLELVLKNSKLSVGTLTGTTVLVPNAWYHLAVSYTVSGTTATTNLYVNGTLEATGTTPLALINDAASLYCVGGDAVGESGYFNGKMAHLRVWDKGRTQAEIQSTLYQPLSAMSNLVAYFPLNAATVNTNNQAVDITGKANARINEAVLVFDNTLPIIPTKGNLISNEYVTMTPDSATGKTVSLMRRSFAYPVKNGLEIVAGKRIESVELSWIGNAQFAPTLLGFIEGAPPVPSENLTHEYAAEDDYNGATSVELVTSEDVEFSWNRSQDSGVGASIETFIGGEAEVTAGLGVASKILDTRAGFKGNLDLSYQFQNESNITASSSLNMTDRLELRGSYEQGDPKFPQLGKRFVPKNIGYALVISAMADVFISRLSRSKKMLGYQMQPVDGIPPDVNTITFMMNPAYCMNGSLDGLTGSKATADRFFKHVPAMRAQFGSLYPASYFRLKEAYNLKNKIEQADKQRESYFANFNALLVDEASLNRQTNVSNADRDSLTLEREEDKPSSTTPISAEEQSKQQVATGKASTKKSMVETTQKQKEIDSKIQDQQQQVHASASFAKWQKRMEDIQVKAGKRNIVNNYVWDADGGLRSEAQSFANTVEHTIGGSFSMNAGLGFEGKFMAGGLGVELTAQATVNMTQTMNKTESRSKGLELNVDLSRVEFRDITDFRDNPLYPGEKVSRYRFMSFYLEGSSNNFKDFFNYVVDPEWLQSNNEESRLLRLVQAGKPNKTWRVLHRVTFVERPALAGFGRDARTLVVEPTQSDTAILQSQVTDLQTSNTVLKKQLNDLNGKLDKIIDTLKVPK